MRKTMRTKLILQKPVTTHDHCGQITVIGQMTFALDRTTLLGALDRTVLLGPPDRTVLLSESAVWVGCQVFPLSNIRRGTRPKQALLYMRNRKVSLKAYRRFCKQVLAHLKKHDLL